MKDGLFFGLFAIFVVFGVPLLNGAKNWLVERFVNIFGYTFFIAEKSTGATEPRTSSVNDDSSTDLETFHSTTASGFFTDFDGTFDSYPPVNIDGTPMCGDVDVHGHPYGVTD
jgi:hypothetical protein